MKRSLIRITSRVILASGVLALIVAAAWFWLRSTSVTTAEVIVREIRPAIQGVGTVEAKVVVQLAAKIPGRVVAINADQGDTVRLGQLLIQLENSESNAEVERAEANLERSKLGVTAQQAALLRAQAALLAAEAAVAKARANRALAHTNADRWRRLAATGDVSQMDMDAHITDAQSADEELKSAEALQHVAAKEIAAQEAGLKIAQNEIAAATAALLSVQAKKSDTIITSPINGYVVSRELEPGAAVNSGTPILKLADPRSVWVTVFVDEREAGPLATGDPADVALRSLPEQKLQGRIARIRRESDRVTEQIALDITLDQPPPRLTLGEQAEASIRPTARRVIAMPLAALIRGSEGFGAWMVADGKLHFRKIRFGAVDPAGWIEIVEGFSAGEQVVIAPGKLVDLSNEGRRVIVTRKSEANAGEPGS